MILENPPVTRKTRNVHKVRFLMLHLNSRETTTNEREQARPWLFLLHLCHNPGNGGALAQETRGAQAVLDESNLLG